MLKFYFNGSPNPTKVALFLEEAGIAYDPHPVDTRKGEQFGAAYLAEKTGKFLPAGSPAVRGELLSWLMFVATGVGPFSGQAVHFRHHATEKQPYAHNRYQYEARRHYGVLDGHLAKRRYMVADMYSIVDMDVWGWARMLTFILGDGAWDKFPNLKRLHDEISARPAAARAVALKDKHKFKAEMDDEARGHMFKHLATSSA